jgi:hypothetical protein
LTTREPRNGAPRARAEAAIAVARDCASTAAVLAGAVPTGAMGDAAECEPSGTACCDAVTARPAFRDAPDSHTPVPPTTTPHANAVSAADNGVEAATRLTSGRAADPTDATRVRHSARRVTGRRHTGRRHAGRCNPDARHFGRCQARRCQSRRCNCGRRNVEGRNAGRRKAGGRHSGRRHLGTRNLRIDEAAKPHAVAANRRTRHTAAIRTANTCTSDAIVGTTNRRRKV